MIMKKFAVILAAALVALSAAACKTTPETPAQTGESTADSVSTAPDTAEITTAATDETESESETEPEADLEFELVIVRNGEESSFTNAEDAEGDAAAEFFVEFFGAAAAGDADRYNALLSDEYIERYGEKIEFTAQKITSVRATQTISSGDMTMFHISFDIADNDGSLFDDEKLASNGGAMLVSLVETEDGYKIGEIYS